MHPGWSSSENRRSGAMWAVLALCLLLAPSRGVAEDTAEATLWVEVLTEKGRAPDGLSAADLEIVEDGVTLPAARLGPAAAGSGGGRVVLYFDRTLSTSRTVKRAAEGLSELARQLIGLGEVEVVVADEEVEVELTTREELILGQKLSRMALTDTGQRAILDLRRRTLRDFGAGGTTELGAGEVAGVVTAGIDEELELVRQRQEQLLSWAAAARPGDGPRLLVLVADGFDLDPVSFYTQYLDEESTRGVLASSSRFMTLGTAVRETARALAASGWTVLPLALQPAAGEAPKDLEYTAIESTDDAGGVTAAPGITLRPGSLFRRREVEESEPLPEPELADPLEPLRLLAQETGGEVVVSGRGLRDVAGRLAGRLELAYRSELPPEAGMRRIEVRALRPGLVVRTRRWLSRGIPEAVSALRARQLLAGIEADGGFDVAAVLRLDEPGEEPAAAGASTGAALEARLGLRELETADGEAGGDATFRVTVATATEEGEPRLSREVLADQDLRYLDEWIYRTTVELPPGATEVAVLVEDLTGGLWGGRRATVVEGRWADDADLLPSPTVIEILRPDKTLLKGRIKLETEVYDPRIARVDFLLDDREVARVERAPFAARVDLGRTPRRQVLEVVAFDAKAAELGRDSVVLNGGSGGLAVEIVRPVRPRGVGPIQAEAEIEVPVERRLDRVLFFWNNQPVSTLYAPPFRQRIVVPADQPSGYIRVVAMLDDGTVAEDVLFMNGPQASERLDVNLVELYVVVTDRDGRPVRGLARQDFQVREEGTVQEIATFSDASDLPLTLGLAIDSSASMFVKLPGVQQAAIQFLQSTFSQQDRAFLVDFGSEPRLARGTTGSLDRLVRSIGSLEASGRTALWESIVFSLVQLQGVRGRKALVVFSDGSDEDDRFPFRSLLDVSKKMGVPIYLILMRKEPKPSSGLSLLVRSFSSRVKRLVEATGGRVFYAKEYRNLNVVYDEIEQELRSQYLLTYYPRQPSGGETWRSVDIDVARKGLKPRTLSGYWQ